MASFNIAFTTVFPLFLLMALGYFLRRVNVFELPFLRKLNGVIFYVFFPVMLFANLYKSSFSNIISNKIVPFTVISILVIFAVLFFIIPVIEKDNRKRGVMIQGIFRSNHMLFGFPIVTALFGEANLGIVSVLIAVLVPIFNILSVIALEAFRGDKLRLTVIVKSCIKNPLIISVFTGFAFMLAGIRLPPVVANTVTDVSRIATPLALIVLGGTFEFSNLAKNAWQLVIVVTGRLLIVPLIVIFIAVRLGFRGLELGALLGAFASSTVVSSYTMAVQMDGDDQLAGQIVVLTSVLSVITLFFFIVFLSPYLF